MNGAETEADIRRRTDRLEQAFGDPGDPDNPLGLRAVLAADERGELNGPAEQLLADEGFGAELVPVGHGGRLDRADVLARIIRPVFRRDLGLGLGHGITSLYAASAVWVAGSAEQRDSLARMLCRGGRAAVVHRSLAHGSALLSGEIAAMQGSRGFRLSGRKEMVLNAARADAFVVHARTDPAPGPRSHAVLLLEPGELPSGRWRRLPRQPSTGLRGCSFSGLAFDDCPVSAETLVGEADAGVRLALRTFQLHRPISAVSMIAAVDTVLRAAVSAAHQGPGGHLRQRHRKLLAGAFADLLACDSMAVVVLRAVHLHPESAHLAAASVKYLVPDLLREDVEELATVIGTGGIGTGGIGTGGIGTGDHGRGTGPGMLAKLMRDLPTASLGHAGTAACQAVVVPQLPLLARRSWFRAPAPSDQLFRPEEPLPPLDFGTLAAVGGEDILAAALVATADGLRQGPAPHPYGDTLRLLTDAFVDELRVLRDRCAAADDRSARSSPEMCALADRHALVSAAGAALGVWERHRHGSGFLGDPSWLVMALHRLGVRLCLDGLPELPDGCVDRVLTEMVERFRAGRGYDLYDAPLAGRAGRDQDGGDRA